MNGFMSSTGVSAKASIVSISTTFQSFLNGCPNYILRDLTVNEEHLRWYTPDLICHRCDLVCVHIDFAELEPATVFPR
jgi:hypothetical protein